MPIIPRVGRKSPNVVLVTISIYVLLALGSVTMIYPFGIMLTASVSSRYDYEKHHFVPHFVTIPGVVNNDDTQFAKYLFDNGIYTTLRYHPLHMNPLYEQTDKELPNSETLNEDALSIPLHPNLTDADVGKVLDKVKAFRTKL